jgi:hypothetical protein
MAHPVTAVQEFFQKAAGIPSSQLVYEFSQYCTDQPSPEQRFVCSLKTPRFVHERFQTKHAAVYESNAPHLHQPWPLHGLHTHQQLLPLDCRWTTTNSKPWQTTVTISFQNRQRIKKRN